MSTTQRHETAQKRTLSEYPARFQAYDLPADFPILLFPRWTPTDGPVTYLHIHECLEIGCCLTGGGILLAGDEVLQYRQGDVCVIRPQELHFIRRDPARETVWRFVFLDPQRLLGTCVEDFQALNGGLLGRPNMSPLVSAADHPEVGESVRLLMDELSLPLGRREAGDRDLVRALTTVVLRRLHRLRRSSVAKSAIPAPLFLRLVPALEHITEAWASALTVPELAARCGMGLRHFDRCFRQATGRRPLDYIARLRIAMACADLASTDKRVITVALDNGFASVSNFNKSFKRVMGMAPKQWRRTIQSISC